MFNGKKVSIVIPCLNEAQALPVVLESIPEYITEVIVVDNGSTDNSAEIAARYPVRLIRQEIRGYGAALSKGIQYAAGDIIILLDADATYPMRDLEEALALMEKKQLDFVSGCRFPAAYANKAMPFINKLGNRLISRLIGVLFKVQIRDSQSGLMLFKRQILDKIKIENKGMGFSQELKIKAWRLSPARCAEVAISYNLRIGTSKFRIMPDGLKNFLALFNLYIKIKKDRGCLNVCLRY